MNFLSYGISFVELYIKVFYDLDDLEVIIDTLNTFISSMKLMPYDRMLSARVKDARMRCMAEMHVWVHK